MSKDQLSKLKNATVSKWAGITGGIPTPTITEPTASSSDWDLAFPVVKRMFAQTIGLDIVPVVPMSAPSGTLFYHDTVYKEEHPLDVLKRVLPKWRDDRKNEILENKVREYLDKAIPGLSNQTIDNAIEDDAKMDHLIWLQSTSNEYGI
jgi:hypothetical protein